MSILVTGGAGYIGSHTVLLLLESGYDVVVLDDLSNSSYESIKRVEQLAKKAVSFYQGSILDSILLNNLLDKEHITGVIHFAGLKSVSESNKEPLLYYTVNVAGTLNLLRCIQGRGVTKFIFSSSATVYGTPERLPLDENCATGDTTNPYGTSKYFVEEMLKDYVKTTDGIKITILRYFNPVGAHFSGMIGEDPNGIPNNLVPYITQVATGKLKQLNIFGNDHPTKDGTGVRDYIHVMDLAAGHLKALEKAPDLPAISVFNLGTGKGYSVLDVITSFEKVSGVKIKYIFSDKRNGDVAECWSNPQVANNTLGWHTLYDLDTMLKDSWNWQKKNPDGYPDVIPPNI
jgi:UDP-glucose 4-epimerase